MKKVPFSFFSYFADKLTLLQKRYSFSEPSLAKLVKVYYPSLKTLLLKGERMINPHQIGALLQDIEDLEDILQLGDLLFEL